MTDFVDRLKLASAHAGVGDSQADIARALEVKRQTVNRWFVIGGAPEVELTLRIAKRFGVDAQWLQTGDGNMVPDAANSPLSAEERALIRDYRNATPKVREVISSMARAARKVAVVVIGVVPPLLSSAPADARPMTFSASALCIMLNKSRRALLAQLRRIAYSDITPSEPVVRLSYS